MELYLVRHGQTDWNLKGKLQGKTDIPLNEKGRTDAIALGNSLDSVAFDCIYSSPLRRAFETACLIRGRRNIPILVEEDLVELGFGTAEGIVCDEWLDPASPYNCFFTSPADYFPPAGGEMLEECMARTARFLQNVIEANADQHQRVMIVAHGALNKGLMCRLENRDKAHYWGEGLQPNCAATVYDYDGYCWKKVN